jgi:hypothetical protein
MKKGVGCWALISFFLVFLFCSPALAKEEKKGQSKDAPSGWDKGEKEGWHSDVPPGSEKKDESIPPDLNKDEQGSTKTKKGKKKEAGEEVVDTEGKAKKPKDKEENKTKEDVKEAEKETDAEDQEVDQKIRKKEEHKKGRRHKVNE